MLKTSEKSKCSDDQFDTKRKRIDNSSDVEEFIEWCKKMNITINEKKAS